MIPKDERLKNYRSVCTYQGRSAETESHTDFAWNW